MPAENTSGQYKVWAVDDVVYGPVNLDTLAEWITEGRVLPETWLYLLDQDQWSRAGEIVELAELLGEHHPKFCKLNHSPLIAGVPAGALRQVRLLDTLSDQQLGRFSQLMQVRKVRQFDTVVQQGKPGDAMYIVLQGSLRVRQLVGDKERVITNLKEGDVFGEVALFDRGERSADVIANQDSILLSITVEAFERMTREMPEVAAPFLAALGQNLAARIRADNTRHNRDILVLRATQN